MTLRLLLPSPVVVRELAGLASSPELFQSEWALVERAIPSRRAEFGTGRILARQALRALNAIDQPILSGADREPLWPKGFVGSITHTNGWCAVAVAQKSAVDYLGIDVEVAISIPSNVSRLIHSPEEVRNAAYQLQLEELTSTVIFSAKESVFKAYFQASASKLTFDQIHIIFDADGSFSAALEFLPAPQYISPIVGTWMVSEGFVMTAAVRLKS